MVRSIKETVLRVDSIFEDISCTGGTGKNLSNCYVVIIRSRIEQNSKIIT